MMSLYTQSQRAQQKGQTICNQGSPAVRNSVVMSKWDRLSETEPDRDKSCLKNTEEVCHQSVRKVFHRTHTLMSI